MTETKPLFLSSGSARTGVAPGARERGVHARVVAHAGGRCLTLGFGDRHGHTERSRRGEKHDSLVVPWRVRDTLCYK
jgi:hypothetical protein